MKTHPNTSLLGLVCLGALASCAESPEPTRMPVSASLRPTSSPLAARVFQDVNAYRRSIGARELKRHAGLDQLALNHSEYLREHRGDFSLHGHYVSHIGFQGRTAVARERYHMDNVSENVAAASKRPGDAAQLLVSLWKASKDHNDNMTDDWTHTGVGVVVDSDGTIFATQIFSTVSNFQLETRERFNSF